MSDYIKREDAVKIIERLAKQLEPPINIRIADVRSGVLSAKWLVEDMQSTDVVEVVRCDDCVHCETRNNEEPYCHQHAMTVSGDYFCADGAEGRWTP